MGKIVRGPFRRRAAPRQLRKMDGGGEILPGRGGSDHSYCFCRVAGVRVGKARRDHAICGPSVGPGRQRENHGHDGGRVHLGQPGGRDFIGRSEQESSDTITALKFAEEIKAAEDIDSKQALTAALILTADALAENGFFGTGYG